VDAEEQSDPVRAFAERLRRLQVESGGPSVRELVRLTGKVGAPYMRATIQDKLAGRSAATWEFVAALVRACGLHAGASYDLRPWRQWHAGMESELAARRIGKRPAVHANVCPFRGLEMYTAEHTAWFHGRADAVQEVLAGLAAHRRGVLLLGPSGSGKSSLVQAGVLPALAAGQLPGSDEWITVLARPGKDLLVDLENAGLPGLRGRPIAAAVAARLASEPSGAHLLLIIDQFEDLLTPAVSDEQDAARREVVDQIAAGIGVAGLTVMLILRDDFYPRLASQAPRLLRALAPGLLNVPAELGSQDLYDIITAPAASVGLDWQDGLPERIITDALAIDTAARTARRAPVTVLPLLELTLQQLWQRRHEGHLTHDAYQRIGGITGAVTTWCDSAFEHLAPERQPIARRILTALVRPADESHDVPAVRQQVPVPELRTLADITDPANEGRLAEQAVDEVLAALIEQRIVTTRTVGHLDGSAGPPVAELVHDALIRDWAALRRWVGEDHRFQDWLRRAAERHTRWTADPDPGNLLRGSDLADGLGWAAQRRLPENTATLLAVSRQYQRTEVRRARRLNAVLAGLLVLALAATGLAIGQRQTAVGAQRVALSRQLAAQSTALIRADPDLASLLAVRAHRTSPTGEAATSVYAAAGLPLKRRLTGVDQGRAVAFSPDGHMMATLGTDNVLRLWDVASAQAKAALFPCCLSVTAVAFSPDGRTLATADVEGDVKLWDVAAQQIRAAMPGHIGPVYSVAFSPDGRTLVTGGHDTTVRLWEVAGGQPLGTLPGRTGRVYSVAFGPDGTLATGGGDATVRLWDLAHRRTLAILRGHTDTVRSVAFSPDGGTLASGSTDTTVRLWDVAGRQTRTTLTGHTDIVNAVAFSPDGRTLASGSTDTTIRLWDVAGQQTRTTLTGHTDAVYAVAFSPDRRTLATGSGDNTVRLWDVVAGQVHTALTGHSGVVNSVAFSPDGQTLATGGADTTTRLSEVTGGRALRTLPGHTKAVTAVAFSPDGVTLATGSTDGSVQLWDVAGGGPATNTLGHTDGVTALQFSKDGHTLAVGSADGLIRLWTMADGRIDTVPGGSSVTAVAFSPDGRTLAFSNRDFDHSVRLWDVIGRQFGVSLTGHTNYVMSIDFSPDGRTVATASADTTVRLWDVAGGRTRGTLTGHTDAVTSVTYSQDGRIVATGSVDGSTRLWDAAGGPARAIQTGPSVYSLAFGPDGRNVAVGGIDGKARLWDVSLPTLTAAIDKICGSVGRDLSAQERATHLPPDQSAGAVCP
jgi:WD40 repeat protein